MTECPDIHEPQLEKVKESYFLCSRLIVFWLQMGRRVAFECLNPNITSGLCSIYL